MLPARFAASQHIFRVPLTVCVCVCLSFFARGESEQVSESFARSSFFACVSLFFLVTEEVIVGNHYYIISACPVPFVLCFFLSSCVSLMTRFSARRNSR